MRKVLLFTWIMLLPLGGLYHSMAGPKHQEMDEIGRTLAEAREMVGKEQWSPAARKFELALQALPTEQEEESRGIRLEMAQAKMNAARLPEAHSELKSLLDELLDADKPNPQFERQVRESLANSQFYITWLMRLEGLPNTEWEPEIESARQNYRMLAETARGSGKTEEARKQSENLEASIRLARLDLTDLQGLPLPNQ